MTNLRVVLIMLLTCSAPAILRSQEQAPPLDGPNHIFHDELLDNMAGTWNLTGKVGSRPMNHSVEVEWVLNHQFLRIHEKDLSSIENAPAYEAMVFVGYDNASERYAAHWIDTFGGRYSETLGYDTRNGDAIEFVLRVSGRPLSHNVSLECRRQDLALADENER